MKLDFTKSSGWAPPKGFAVDTATLPAEEKAELEKLIADSGVLTSAGSELEGLRDGDEYYIELTTDAGTHHWRWYGFGSPTEPCTLVNLLKYCSARAQPLRR